MTRRYISQWMTPITIAHGQLWPGEPMLKRPGQPIISPPNPNAKVRCWIAGRDPWESFSKAMEFIEKEDRSGATVTMRVRVLKEI